MLHNHLAMATKPTHLINNVIILLLLLLFSLISDSNKVTLITPFVYFLSAPLCVENKEHSASRTWNQLTSHFSPLINLKAQTLTTPGIY